MSNDQNSLTQALTRALAQRHDVELALLFGSRAKQRATASSDIDIAVWAPDVDLLELAAELGAELRAEVDIVSLQEPPIPLLEELIADAVVIHESAPGRAAAWRARALVELETDRPWYARMRDAWLAQVAKSGI